MKPTKEDRKKFDIDLQYGEVREDKIADMLTNKKIEVKSERCLLYTSPSPRDPKTSRMPSSA